METVAHQLRITTTVTWMVLDQLHVFISQSPTLSIVDFCMDIGDKAMVDKHVGTSGAKLWLFHFKLFTSLCQFLPSERVW